jgi:hypothetical protein
MFLHQHPAEHRQQKGEPDVNGIWFWDAAEWPQAVTEKKVAVATCNPFLRSIVDGTAPKLIITEAERATELIKQAALLPRKIVLAGEGYAVVLTKSLFSKFTKTDWLPKMAKPENELIAMLSGFFS